MLDPEVLTGLGLVGLFVSAFLAGSILPFASEAVLAGVLLVGAPAVTAVVVATIGNVLGALTVYAIGRLMSRGEALDERFLRRVGADDPERLERARRQIERFGPLALLFAWVPVVGDILVLAAGLARLDVARVTFATTLGKAGRYTIVASTVLRLAS